MEQLSSLLQPLSVLTGLPAPGGALLLQIFCFQLLDAALLSGTFKAQTVPLASCWVRALTCTLTSEAGTRMNLGSMLTLSGC